MSSNVPITPGSGLTVAAEDISGLKYQQIKLIGGEVGSTSVLGITPDNAALVSVLGTVKVAIQGSVNVVGTTPNQSVSGAVTSPPGSVLATVNPPGSVMGVRTDNASVITVIQTSSLIAVPTGNQSISGAVTAPSGSVLSVATPAGSVIAIRADNASIIAVIQGSSIIAVATGNQSVSGAITAPPGSVMATNQPAGSILAVAVFGTGTNSSVLGSVTALQGTNPWTVVTPAASVQSTANPAGSITAVRTDNASVITTQPAGSVLAVSGTFTTPGGSVQSTTTPAGSVMAVRTDNASVIAVFQNSSIIAVPVGSVIAVIQSSSILAIPVGSIIAVLQAPSVVGTYAEDSASASADKGVFGLNVRNDTLASVTSTDGDYSALSVGPSGEVIVANSPITKWVQGTADFRQGNTGASLQILAVGGTSVFTYITAAQVANMGAASVLVTLASSGSILGYTIAPAGGGSNIYYPNGLKTPSNGNFAASLSGIASVLISVQGFVSKI